MQERHHVKTTPGEAKAPEVVPHPVRKEPDPHTGDTAGNVQMDDINIPLVAIAVAFFAVLLAVSIVSLQAWFYNSQEAERARKTVAQDSRETWLGGILHDQRVELSTNGPLPNTRKLPEGEARKMVIPINEAMTKVQQQYAQSNGGGSR